MGYGLRERSGRLWGSGRGGNAGFFTFFGHVGGGVRGGAREGPGEARRGHRGQGGRGVMWR